MVNTMKAIEKMNWKAEECTCAVQGFGNVGSWGAKLISEQGVKVVAISDYTSGIYQPEGIDIRDAVAYLKSHGTLAGYSEGESLTNKELLSLDVDILVPAAIEGVINEGNAEEVQARLIVEGANGPVSANADAILDGKGTLIVPDILANAGGVVVSYFEWVQNRRGHYYSEDEIRDKAAPILVDAFDRVYATHLRYQCSMRLAAYIVAIERLKTGIDLEGNF